MSPVPGVPTFALPISNDASETTDTDGDGVGDVFDNCPNAPNPEQDNLNNCEANVLDSDGDGVGNVCDICPGGDDLVNSDSDTWPDDCDNCPNDANQDQLDSDGDGVGDNSDAYPYDAALWEEDAGRTMLLLGGIVVACLPRNPKICGSILGQCIFFTLVVHWDCLIKLDHIEC